MVKDNVISAEQSATKMEETTTKKRLSDRSKEQSFGHFISGNLAEVTMPVMPQNTWMYISGALMKFRDWRAERAKRYPKEVCFEGLLDNRPWDFVSLNQWLSIFIQITCTSGGKQCLFSNIYQMLNGILHYMCSVDPLCSQFLDEKDHYSKELHAAADNLGRQLYEVQEMELK